MMCNLLWAEAGAIPQAQWLWCSQKIGRVKGVGSNGALAGGRGRQPPDVGENFLKLKNYLRKMKKSGKSHCLGVQGKPHILEKIFQNNMKISSICVRGPI